MKYRANGVDHQVALIPMETAVRRAFAPAGAARAAGAMSAGIEAAIASLTTRVGRSVRRSSHLASRFAAGPESPMMLVQIGSSAPGRTLTIATPTVAVEGARPSDIAWAKSTYGTTVLEEGNEGKLLLGVGGGGREAIQRAFELASKLIARGVAAAHPNFIRALPRVQLSPQPSAAVLWNHQIMGLPTAWKTTKGRSALRVAVLDEGVDTRHPALRAAVVAEHDFIGSQGDDARPSGDDAHGTACAGIIVGRTAQAPGIAPRCSLMAARITQGDGNDGWIFDDFKTADAIDWCWRRGADVLSNSWGGGPPVDVITRAFERARTLGREGKGCVVAVAAGNDQTPVDYPATLPGVLAVGASNEYDERKTRASHDGENWWGSNYGPALALLAPGVHITTTDISGPAGYESGNFTATFNGTSSATPHVAGAALLVLAVAPHLRASQVRQILIGTAKKLPKQKGWTKELGHGRLDVAAAVAAAKTAPTSPAVLAVPAGRPAKRRKRG